MQESSIDPTAIWDTVAEMVSTYGLRVVGAIALLIVGMMIAKIIRASVRKTLRRSNLDDTLIPFVSGLVYYLAVAVVLIAVLELFGVQAASLIAVLGAVGLAVGLALQGTLSNFASGVMLLIFRPFRIGDYVEAAGVAGSVEQIGVFSTLLNTPDNVKITVPNSAVYGSIIKNYAANDTRRLDMVMGISYSDDIGKAIEVIERLVKSDERVLADPAPTIAVAELADSSVNLVVRPWCKKEDYWGLKFHLTRQMKEQLEAAGCSIPFPQRDVHLFRESA